MSTENLWAPWRMQYLAKLDPEKGIGDSGDGPACFICDAIEHAHDAEAAAQRLILSSDERGIVMLNRFPYTNGHVLIAPPQHIGDLPDMSAAQRAALMELTVVAEQAVRLAYHPQGFNVGINIGRAAGAGLPGHLHMHVLPRWAGDTNFITTVGDVRVMPQALEESYQLLKEAMGKVRG